MIDEDDEIKAGESKKKPTANGKRKKTTTKTAPIVDEIPEEEPAPKAKAQDGRMFNGGARRIPPKAEGAPKAARARTFQSWVAGLVKREAPPHHFDLELQDGETKTVLLTKSARGNVLLAECLATIESFEPVKVEAWSRDEDDEETTLGRWLFPVKEPPAATETNGTSSAASLVSTTPGYVVNDTDEGDPRMLKIFAHLLADAYRQNSDRVGSLLDAMGRVMETQANAFARERESMDKTIQTRERIAKMSAMNRTRLRVATDHATPERDTGDEELEEEQVQQAEQSEELFGAFMKTFATEYAKRAAAGAAGAAPEPPKAP